MSRGGRQCSEELQGAQEKETGLRASCGERGDEGEGQKERERRLKETE